MDADQEACPGDTYQSPLQAQPRGTHIDPETKCKDGKLPKQIEKRLDMVRLARRCL